MDSNLSFDSLDSSNLSYMNFPPSSAAAATNSMDINHHQPSSSFQRSLHAVRKPAYTNKKPGATPLPPNPTRVYKVDRMKFRELVQMLTGASAVSTIPASHSQPRRLREVAPPPLDFAIPAPPTSHSKAASATTSTPLSAVYRELMTETLPDARLSHHQRLSSDSFLTTSSGPVSLGLGLSPSSPGWCSFLSPGTLSSFEPGTVL